jgi:hypothetical protein
MTSPSRNQIASSVRLIVAMFRLYADINSNFGKAILDILKKQYPDQVIDMQPGTVGSKLMAIARGQNQNDDQRAMDAIQEFLLYISSSANGGKGWDFRKDFGTWQEALRAIYSNVRRKSMSKSMDHSKRKKNERSVDDAFGKRGEDGGSPEGGEGKMPTPDTGGGATNLESAGELGKALDDKASISEFYDLLSMHIPDLKQSLSPETRLLFEIIFDDEIGTFGSDIKENMGQSEYFKEKVMNQMPSLYEEKKSSWPGFAGRTRDKLMKEIWDYVDNEMSDNDYKRLKEHFFGETTPKDVSKIRNEKKKEKSDYLRGLDERKLGRLKWMQENGKNLSPKDQKAIKTLSDRLRSQGVDPDSIASIPVKGGKMDEEEDISQVASILASVSTASFEVSYSVDKYNDPFEALDNLAREFSSKLNPDDEDDEVESMASEIVESVLSKFGPDFLDGSEDFENSGMDHKEFLMDYFDDRVIENMLSTYNNEPFKGLGSIDPNPLKVSGMSTFPTMDSLIASFPPKKHNMWKEGATVVANIFQSFWRSQGSPGIGEKPSSLSGAACSRTTIGSAKLSNVSGGKKNYLSMLTFFSGSPSMMMIIDRTLHTDSLVSNTTSSQTINSVTLPSRAGNGVGLEMGIEIFAQTGVTTYNVNVSYTNSSNVSGRTATTVSAISSNAAIGRFFPLQLQDDDEGVKSVQSASCSVSSGTAGEFGIVLYRPIHQIYVMTGSSSTYQNMFETGLIQIHEDSCISFVIQPTVTSTGRIELSYDMVQAVPALWLF